jgi:hypothetical protein
LDGFGSAISTPVQARASLIDKLWIRNIGPTSAWVPLPHVVAVLTGGILVALGTGMRLRKTAVSAITGVGMLIPALTIGLFAPELFLARGVAERVTVINFVPTRCYSPASCSR